jgi:hypothetical protein
MVDSDIWAGLDLKKGVQLKLLAVIYNGGLGDMVGAIKRITYIIYVIKANY